MKIYCDIDGTICTLVKDANYANAEPLEENIAVMNSFYKRHKIIYWTARGTETGIDWKQTTYDQFKKWGVKYHGIEFGKPSYDLFICDKAINAKALKRFK